MIPHDTILYKSARSLPVVSSRRGTGCVRSPIKAQVFRKFPGMTQPWADFLRGYRFLPAGVIARSALFSPATLPRTLNEGYNLAQKVLTVVVLSCVLQPSGHAKK